MKHLGWRHSHSDIRHISCGLKIQPFFCATLIQPLCFLCLSPSLVLTVHDHWQVPELRLDMSSGLNFEWGELHMSAALLICTCSREFSRGSGQKNDWRPVFSAPCLGDSGLPVKSSKPIRRVWLTLSTCLLRLWCRWCPGDWPNCSYFGS